MHLEPCWIFSLCSFVLLNQAVMVDLNQEDALKARTPKKPVLPDTFQVELEGLFKQDESQLEGSVFFDRVNNRAAVDYVFNGDRRKMIYNFGANEFTSIQGTECVVDEITDDPGESLFPFTVDKKRNKKILDSAEKAFRFHDSTYFGEEYIAGIPFYVYMGQVDLPQLKLTGCTVKHVFTETNFETATCEGTHCKPIISRIEVHCPNTEGDEEIISHLYQFFQFDESVPDDSVFHAHPGVFCSRKATGKMPDLPVYFSFSYDTIFQETQNSPLGTVRSLHKKLWYEGGLQLVRVEDYNEKKILQYTTVYDFMNGVSYVIPAKMENGTQGEIDRLKQDMTLSKASLLPEDIFPYKFRKSNSEPVYVGKRNVHGLAYHVWSAMTEIEEESLKVVSDMYFVEVTDDKINHVNKSSLLLSFIEFYAYEEDDSQQFELVQTRFIPLNDFRAMTHNLSAFDVSPCFSEYEKKLLQIKIKGPHLEIGSKEYDDVLEKLYLNIALLSGDISIIRISSLKIIFSDEDISAYEGYILEDPFKLGFGRNNSEPDMETAYEQLDKGIELGLLSFNATDENGKVSRYTATCLNCSMYNEYNKFKKGEHAGYSSGAMAGIAIVMLIIGIVLGVVSLVTFLRNKKREEVQKFVNSS